MLRRPPRTTRTATPFPFTTLCRFGHPPPFDFPGKERWRRELFALGVGFEDVDYVFCTHLHIDHTGWNTTLRDGRWMPTFPNAKYVFHKGEYAVWEEQHRRGANPPGTVFREIGRASCRARVCPYV